LKKQAMKPGRRLRIAVLAGATLATTALAACAGGDSSTPVAAEGDETGPSTRERVVIESSGGAFSFGEIYSKVVPGVVTIRSIFGGGAGQGSGFVVDESGEILTNAHVVTDGDTSGNAQITEASQVFVEFADRNQVPAEVVGFDPHADVALLKVDTSGIDMTVLELAQSGDVDVGDPVAAIGSPFGEEQSLSVGVVSATDRSIPSLTDFRIDGAVQTDASINPGNSGGPLLDKEGRVIGINQQIDTATGSDDGVGFAVPIAAVRRSLEQLRDGGEVRYAFIGVTTQALYPQLAERLGLDASVGALIAEVVADGPADRGGLEAGSSRVGFQSQDIDAGGDVIVSIDGTPIVGESDLSRIVSTHLAGETVEVEVLRDGRLEKLEVELGERPERA